MEDASLSAREEMLELRRRGLVPWSRAAGRCAALAASTAMLLYLFEMQGGYGRWRDAFSRGALSYGALVKGAAILLVSTSIVSCAVALLAALIQTRFFVQFRVIRWGREFDTEGASAGGLVGAVTLGGVLSGALAYRYLPPLFSLIRRGELSLSADIGIIAGDLSRVVIVGATLLAILSGTISRYLFRRNNRGRISSKEGGH